MLFMKPPYTIPTTLLFSIRNVNDHEHLFTLSTIMWNMLDVL